VVVSAQTWLRRRPALELNAYALMLSTVAVAALGLLFWVGAARVYSASAVGQASAEVAAITLLAVLSQLNLINVLPRFLPMAGAQTTRFVATGYIAAIALALVSSTIFVATPLRHHILVDVPGTELIFVAAVVLVTVFTIQDAALIGLGASKWVPVENFMSSALKIALLVVFGAAGLHFGIVAAWLIPTIAAILVVNVYIFGRLAPARVRRSAGTSALPGRRTLVVAALAEYGTGIAQMIVPQVVPLLVVASLGSAENGYFYQPLLLNSAIGLLVANVATALVVEASTHIDDAPRLLRKAVKLAFAVALPAAAVEVFFASQLMGLLGHDYVTHGAIVTQTLGWAVPLNVVNILFACVCRIERRYGRLFCAQASLATAIIATSAILVGPYGIHGVAIGYASAQAAFGLALAYPLWRQARTLGTHAKKLERGSALEPVLVPEPALALTEPVFVPAAAAPLATSEPYPAAHAVGVRSPAHAKRTVMNLTDPGYNAWRHALLFSAVLAVVMPCLVAADIDSPGRVLLALIYLVIIPGLPVAVLVGTRRMDTAITITAAVSIACNLLVPLVMLQAHIWHPLVADVVMSAIALTLTALAFRPAHALVSVA
jgi:O-antigen/teichoic acid export membrane protein